MTLYYNAPKNGNNIGTIKGNLDNCLSTFNFDCAKIIKEENAINIVLKLTKTPTDVVEVGNKSLDLTGQLIALTFHKSEYEKNIKNKETGNFEKVKTKPHHLELLFCKLLSEIDETKQFKGQLCLFDNPVNYHPLLTNKNKQGNELSEMEYSFYKSQVFDIEYLEEAISELENIAFTSTPKSSNYAPKKTQGELINERIAFVNEQLKDPEKLLSIVYQLKSLKDQGLSDDEIQDLKEIILAILGR